MSDLPMTLKTKTGGLDFHIAGAACYVPFFMLNYIAPLVFLLTEPREHQPVRFHAAQSLLVSVTWVVSTIVIMVLSWIIPPIFIVAGDAMGSDLVAMLGMLLMLLLNLLLFAVLLGGMALLMGLAVWVGLQNNPRVPLLARFADRIAGQP